MCMEFCVIITNNENLETTKRAAMILKCDTNKCGAPCHVRRLLITEKWSSAEMKIQRGEKKTYPKTGGS